MKNLKKKYVPMTEPSRKVVQAALPGFMLNLALVSLFNQTHQRLRADYEQLVGKASALPLQGLLPAEQIMNAEAIETEGYAILKAAGTDDMKALTIGLCMMLIVFKDRGVDVEENSILVSLALVMEAEEEEGSDAWGPLAPAKEVAVKLENEARRRGFFSHLVEVGDERRVLN